MILVIREHDPKEINMEDFEEGLKKYPPGAFDPKKNTWNWNKLPPLKPHPSQVEFFERMARNIKPGKKRPTYKRADDAPQCRKVIDIETGVIFDSIKDCAEEHCMHYRKIFTLLKGINKNACSLRLLE
jgi:hypothetical protein